MALQDGRAVGTVSAVPRGPQLYMRSMAVHPASRGGGCGRLLLAAVEAIRRAATATRASSSAPRRSSIPRSGSTSGPGSRAPPRGRTTWPARRSSRWKRCCRPRGALTAFHMMEDDSIIMEAARSPAVLNRRIAGRVRDLRAARGLSLEDLAARSGVSRSMISLVERGESSPTAVVLEKLATGLGVMLASLFDEAPAAAPRRRRSRGATISPSGRIRHRATCAGTCRRRACPQPMHIVEVHFPPGGRVAFETGARAVRVHQQVWVLEGAIDVTVGRERHRAAPGRLPGDGARSADDVPQPDAPGRALCGRVRGERGRRDAAPGRTPGAADRR